jgi:transcriptional regulator with XRE-family HTH domain
MGTESTKIIKIGLSQLSISCGQKGGRDMAQSERIITLLEAILGRLGGEIPNDDSAPKSESVEPEELPFNKLLQCRMEAQGMTRAELSRAVGVSRAAVSGWFNGSHQPHTKQIEKIADVLGCTVEEFNATRPTRFGGSEPVELRQITIDDLAKRIKKSPQSIRIALQRGSVDYGRAYMGSRERWIYEVYPGKVKELFGIDFFAEWRSTENAA